MDKTTANLVHKQVFEFLKKYSSDYMLDRDQFNKLMSLCDLADMIVSEFDGEISTIVIDPALCNGVISVNLSEMVMEDGRKHPFFTHLKHADFLRFTHKSADTMCVQFGVNNLWEANL